MPTNNQLGRGMRSGKQRHSRVMALAGGPQRKCSVYKVATMTPRKPNSAKRTYAKVFVILTNKRVFAKIPGIGQHYLQAHSTVIIRGQGPKDSPGVNYHLIRGLEDFTHVELYGRRNRRSKFGAGRLQK